MDGDNGDDKFIQLIKDMKINVNSKKATSPTKEKLFKRIMQINTDCQSLPEKIKIEILQCWFSEAITGPYCITRCLDVVTSNELLNDKALSCDTINKIKLKTGDYSRNFWKFNIKFLNLIDNKYYLITGHECEALVFQILLSINILV